MEPQVRRSEPSGTTMLDIWIGDSEVSAQWKLGVKHVECTPDGYETWEEYWASDEGKQAAAEMG